jgi:hypothetical protein
MPEFWRNMLSPSSGLKWQSWEVEGLYKVWRRKAEGRGLVQRFTSCGAHPPGGGGGVDSLRDIFVFNEIWVQGKIYILLGTFTYRLIPVLVLNYKQCILSLAKVRKECYSLAELYVICVCLNLFGWRGAWRLWNILKEGASYKIGNLWANQRGGILEKACRPIGSLQAGYRGGSCVGTEVREELILFRAYRRVSCFYWESVSIPSCREREASMTAILPIDDNGMEFNLFITSLMIRSMHLDFSARVLVLCSWWFCPCILTSWPELWCCVVGYSGPR